MFRARMFAICCGYEDADDLDHLRSDPAFKLACGRLPDTGRDLYSQPTLSRLENAPCLRDVIRLTYALVEAWMDSYTPNQPGQTMHLARAHGFRRGADCENWRRHGTPACHSNQKTRPPGVVAIRSWPTHAPQNLGCRKC
jgi:hypothetical protein